MSTFLRNKTISKTTPLRKENPFPQFNVASHKCPGIRLSFEYTTTLLSGEGGERRTGTATMFRKMLSKYRIFSTVLSKIVGIYLTWVVSASLNSGREKTSLALTSNCFLLLNLNSEADLCIFDWPSKSLPCASSLVSRCPLNKESSSSTSSELWGLGFAEGSLGFDSSATDSASDISAIKLTVNASESGMRERERAHSTRTNLWCRLTNQKVPESPVENCNIPAEKNIYSKQAKISG